MADALEYGSLSFRPLVAEDFLAIDRQPSQRVCMHGEPPTLAAALQLEEQAESWSVFDGAGRLLACMGILEVFKGRCGVVWAVLAEPIGSHHLAISRFARGRIQISRLGRLEALARAVDVEPMTALLVDAWGRVDHAALLRYAMAKPTPECRWPPLLGLEPVHVVRRFGATGEAYVLFERVLPVCATAPAEMTVSAHG
jgi:hypothetical protein